MLNATFNNISVTVYIMAVSFIGGGMTDINYDEMDSSRGVSVLQVCEYFDDIIPCHKG
jgi:hypothetical protein